MTFTKPTTTQIREALQRYAPALADAPIEFLGEGWSLWAFEAGAHVLRFPKEEASIAPLTMERLLLSELAGHISIPVPRIDVYGESGPNNVPFAGHRKIPGLLVMTTSSRRLARSFGTEMGRFMRDLRDFHADHALALGAPLRDGPTLRARRAEHYEDVIRRVFPVVSCEARTEIERVYETYLNEPANFDYEPRLTHQDLDSNTLVDAETGDLSGVIDFCDAELGDPAIDLWLPVFGFPRLGIEAQTADCLAAAGVSDADLRRMMPSLAFYNFRYALLDILHGLDTGDASYVEGGIRALNASLPPDLRC